MGTRVDNLEERILELEEKNKKLIKALKMYADYNFYNVKFDIYKSPLTNREEIYRTWILDKKGTYTFYERWLCRL